MLNRGSRRRRFARIVSTQFHRSRYGRSQTRSRLDVLLQDPGSVLGEHNVSEEIHGPATEVLLETHKVEPHLSGNLLFIAHWHEEAQRRIVHDVAGYFTADQLTPPPSVANLPNSQVGMLNELDRGKLYDFHV